MNLPVRGLSRHAPFAGLLAAAAVLRVLVGVAFHPVLWFLGDSITYVEEGVHFAPGRYRPSGYGALLWLLHPLHSLLAVAIVQQVFGLGLGIGCYAVALRLGLPRRSATLVAVPVLFDGYLVAVEQTLLSETLFLVLLLASLGLLLWWRLPRVPVWAAAAAGLLLALAVLTRSVALPIVAVLASYLLLRDGRPPRLAGLVRATALVTAFALPVVAYAAWYDSIEGEFTVSATGVQLYAHVLSFAHCQTLQLPAADRPLCPPPRLVRTKPEDWFAFSPHSPVYRQRGPFAHRDRLARSFAARVILARPFGYLTKVLHTVGDYVSASTGQERAYDFGLTIRRLPRTARRAGRRYLAGGDPRTHVVRPLATGLRWYQRLVYVPGPVYLLGFLIALAGCVLGRDETPYRRRLAVGLLGAVALCELVVPALAVPFVARYRLVMLPELSLAVALSLPLLRTRWRDRRELPPPAARPG